MSISALLTSCSGDSGWLQYYIREGQATNKQNEEKDMQRLGRDNKVSIQKSAGKAQDMAAPIYDHAKDIAQKYGV